MPNPDKPDYSHGSTGTKPGSAIDYDNGDPVDESEFDYFIYTLFSKLKAIINTLNSLDSDGDGRVDAADHAINADDTTTVKGNDIDSDGNGRVNAADHATQADNTTTVKNNDIDSDGDGVVDEADYANDADASTYKGGDIDSDGDGVVDAADSAGTASAYKGNDIDSDGDGTVDEADYAFNASASSYKGYDIDSNGDGVVDNADQLQGNSPSDLIQHGTSYIPDVELNTGQKHVLFRIPSTPSGMTLDITEIALSNSNFNTPSGLYIIVYEFDSDTGHLLDDSYTSGEPAYSFDIGGSDILVAIDNGDIGPGTGSVQQASAIFTAELNE